MDYKTTSHIIDSEIQIFQNQLINWFNKNGRKFPWRNKSASNYQLIISEVLLQRTRAETVAKFFPQFINKYPSWKQLGYASERDLQVVLKPLGLYKQRGSRLYKLAQEMKKRNGRFPKSRSEVEEMPMMGQYLTNAYELFILKRNSPLLDVNMARVLEKYFGQRKLADIRFDPYLQELSKKLVNHTKSAKINWAILDFGALICKKLNKKCNICIFNDKCNFYTNLK